MSGTAPPPEIISSVSDDQHAILRSIATLYTGGTFDLDPTYSTGQFYREGVPAPRLKFDLAPRSVDVQQADCRHLPLPDASVASIVFDPPFIHAHGKASVIGNRFDSLPSQKAIRALYADALTEFARILQPRGILAFKCQDIIESGKQILTHCHVWQMAQARGFIDRDLFVLVAKNRLIGHNHGRQQHARKFHSYMFVLEKGRGK